MFTGDEMEALESVIEFRSSMGLSTHEQVTRAFGIWRELQQEIEVLTQERDSALQQLRELTTPKGPPICD